MEGREREEARRPDTPQEDMSQMEIFAKKDQELRGVKVKWTQSGGEASWTYTYCQSRCKKWHMMNIYATDSGEEATVDFVKDHEEFYNKTHERD